MVTRNPGTSSARATAAGVLVLEVGVAVLGLVIHYSFTAEYGDVTDLAAGGWLSRASAGIGAVVPVAVVALVAVSVMSQRWVRLAAVAIPVLAVMALIVVTRAALQAKLVDHYDETPRCALSEGPAGPGTRAATDAQRAFDSIEHVGHFGGGGASGVGGCDRSLLVVEEVAVLQHYRAALPGAGWRVVEDDARHLRGERDGMAFEVVVCGRGGVVWAGDAGISGGARCRPTY